ncbi:MAG: translation initiation factor IF-6 [Thermoprotei archaeon]|nr:MAG: translation initiation factor IF-6 [Thermoprotei archaeon]RLF18613.1 MAG: translation initiation factor IF-6 [Thermoprotei archaeon]
MSVEALDVYGSVCVGAFCFANHSLAIIPDEAPKKLQEALEENLKVKVVRVKVADSPLVGILVAGNENGILLPRSALPEEVEVVKREGEGLNVEVVDSKRTALGNLILANDKAALIHPDLTDREAKRVEDVLGVEVVRGAIAGIPFVGSTTLLNNRGLLTHPLAGEDELKWLEELFKVKAEGGTINHGSPLLRVGAVVNDHGALVGSLTTGLEIAKLERVLLAP